MLDLPWSSRRGVFFRRRSLFEEIWYLSTGGIMLPAMGRVPSVLRHYCVLRSYSTSFRNGGLLAAMTVQHKRGIKSKSGKIILSVVASILRAQFFVEMWTTGTTSDLTGIYR